ncbi:hypothetical protein BC826DRAFT_1046295, partial [Russula brevipes]
FGSSFTSLSRPRIRSKSHGLAVRSGEYRQAGGAGARELHSGGERVPGNSMMENVCPA